MASIKEAEKQQTQSSGKLIDTSQFKNFDTMYSALTPEARKAFWSRTIQQIIVTPSGDYLITFN